jgi:hypothetical protein
MAKKSRHRGAGVFAHMNRKPEFIEPSILLASNRNSVLSYRSLPNSIQVRTFFWALAGNGLNGETGERRRFRITCASPSSF